MGCHLRLRSRRVEDRVEVWCATGGDTAETEWGHAELDEHARDEHSTDRSRPSGDGRGHRRAA
jgi:hypothetical protein